MSDPRQPARGSQARPESGAAKTWQVGTLVYTAGSLTTLYAWLLWGDFAWQLKDRTGPIVQVALGANQASDFVTALFMVSVPAAISMTLGPVIGVWSDRHRGPRGRRIPFLLVTTPIAGLALAGVACGPSIGRALHVAWGGSPTTLSATVLATMGVFWLVFELATVTANTVFGALINDVVPRELIGRFYGLFRVVSIGVGIGLFYFVMGRSKEHFQLILVTVSAVYVIGFMLMCLKVREGSYPAPDESTRTLGLFATLRGYLRDCFAHPYYLTVFTFMALAVTSFIPVNLYMVFASQSFGLSLTDYGRCMAAMFAVSFVAAYPLGWMADRFHAARVGLVCLVAYALVTGLGFFVVRGPTSFAALLFGHGLLSVCYNTGVASLGQMLFPQDRFAQFAAAATFMSSLLSIVVSPLVGLILDHLGRDYRFIFGLSSLLALAALLVGTRLYRLFRQHGGPHHYVAPV